MIAASSNQYPPHNPYMVFVSDSDLTPVKDNIFRPKHYAQFWPEPVTVVNAWGLNFNRGNAIKYIARAGHKNDEAEDLRKAIRYLEIELECMERRRAAAEGQPPQSVWSETL